MRRGTLSVTVQVVPFPPVCRWQSPHEGGRIWQPMGTQGSACAAQLQISMFLYHCAGGIVRASQFREYHAPGGGGGGGGVIVMKA